MSDLHMEALSESELVDVIDQALASLNARLTDDDTLAELFPADDPEVIKAEIERACNAWDPVADHWREACDCGGGWAWPMASDGDSTFPFVERCDDCQVFADDIVAAEALAATIEGGHVVMKPVRDDPARMQPAVYPCEGWVE